MARVDAFPEATSDPDLLLIVARWNSLPEAVRAGIVAMVQAASVVPSRKD